jgi:hypothetical protein
MECVRAEDEKSEQVGKRMGGVHYYHDGIPEDGKPEQVRKRVGRNPQEGLGHCPPSPLYSLYLTADLFTLATQ